MVDESRRKAVRMSAGTSCLSICARNDGRKRARLIVTPSWNRKDSKSTVERLDMLLPDQEIRLPLYRWSPPPTYLPEVRKMKELKRFHGEIYRTWLIRMTGLDSLSLILLIIS